CPPDEPTPETTPAPSVFLSPYKLQKLRCRAWELFDQVRIAGLESGHPKDWRDEEHAYGASWDMSLGKLEIALAAEHSAIYKNAAEESDPYRLYERTFFNRKAFDSIHDKDFPLNKNETTARLKRKKKRREVNEFAPDAIAVKTFWRVVPKEKNPEIP